MTEHQETVKAIAALLRRRSYSYDQVKHIFADARRELGLKPPGRAKRRSAETRLTKDEVERLIATGYALQSWQSSDYGLMIRVLFETGARVKSFVAVRVEDIRFDELEIHFPHEKGDVYRIVPIMPELAEKLKLYLRHRESGFLFPSPRWDKPMLHVRTVQKMVKRAAEHAGLGDKKVTPHQFRHAIAQYLADQGMQPDLLQRFLGHANPATTQVYYEPRRPAVAGAYTEAMK